MMIEMSKKTSKFLICKYFYVIIKTYDVIFPVVDPLPVFISIIK